MCPRSGASPTHRQAVREHRDNPCRRGDKDVRVGRIDFCRIWVKFHMPQPMPAKIDIPRKSIYRLSIYQRCLQRLRENQVDTVSSAALAKAAGVKSTQLRKDLAYFGQLGTRGLGYNVDALSSTIGLIRAAERKALMKRRESRIPST